MATKKIIIARPVEKNVDGNRTDVTSSRTEIEDASEQDILQSISQLENDGAGEIIIQLRAK